MPIITWLSPQEITPCCDNDLSSVLTAIELLTGERWVVLPHMDRPWSKILSYLRALTDPPHTRYSLYFHRGGNEYQVINFYLERSGTSINPIVPKEVAMAYLLGLLGRAQGETRHEL